MAKAMKAGAVLSTALTIVFALLGLESPAITAGTFAYHLLMRLAVGAVFDRTLNNHVNVRMGWFRQQAWETKLYEKLRVSQWKTSMPTYDPQAFDRHKHSWEEIAQAMCQAEWVHEVIVLLSFLPVVAARWFGALPVFVLTSLAAAAFDMMFVVMQRYNRPRVMKIADRLKKRN